MRIRNDTDLPTPLRPRMQSVWPRLTEETHILKHRAAIERDRDVSKTITGPIGGGPGGAIDGGPPLAGRLTKRGQVLRQAALKAPEARVGWTNQTCFDFSLRDALPLEPSRNAE